MHQLNNQHCCVKMSQWIKDEQCPLMYYPKWRSYKVSAPKILLKKNEIWKGYKVYFCPSCSAKLPSNLVDQWSDILQQEYGIDDLLDEQQKKRIPPEFQTDEWWKKRGFQDKNGFSVSDVGKQHDCLFLSYALEDDTPLFFYTPSNNTYTMCAPDYLLQGKKWPYYTLIFCPWCGGRLY